MKKSNRLSITLHALVHMADQPEAAVTSEVVAGWLQTNPVVVRRTFGLLRDAGFVNAARGPGGGWMLARPAEAISVNEIYAALGERVLVGMGVAAVGHSGCAIQKTVSAALHDVIEQAETRVADRLSTVTLADLLAGGQGGFAEHRKKRKSDAV